FLLRAFACELAQLAQGHLDVARAELAAGVEIGEFAPIPYLDRTPVARAVLADADAFRVEAIGAERRGAGRANPFAATLVAAVLLAQALAQRLHELVPAAQGLDAGLLLCAQFELGHALQPIVRNRGLRILAQLLDAFEVMREQLVEAIEFALILDQ